MANNRTKADALHDLLPKHLNTRNNTNWKALIDAIGQSDQTTAELIAEVRNQFFIKTASRPHIDRLAANYKISRPRLVGMDDPSFRRYIPIIAYQPKQVKLIIDQLLNIFFFKEATTAYVTSSAAAPYNLSNNWELTYKVDEIRSEVIGFNSSEFTDITQASAAEIVSAINRQAKYSHATVYYDSITKNSYVRLFTNTIGSKGSLRITGGRANIALRFDGFIDTAGNGNNTQWSVTKIGNTTTFEHIGGNSPSLDQVNVGDVVIINLSGNVGSFIITEVDLANNLIRFINLFSTAGTYTQTSSDQVKFMSPNKYVCYINPKRAVTWETAPGEIVVEMPSSPPVVKRSLAGSWHINGSFSLMTNRDSDNSITLQDASLFPNSGFFYIEESNEIKSRILTISENTVVSKQSTGRQNGKFVKYEYTSRTVLDTTGNITENSNQITGLASVTGIAIGDSIIADGVPFGTKITSISGFIVTMNSVATNSSTGIAVKFCGNTLTGITPNIPVLADLNEFTLSSLERNGSNTGVASTATAHGYNIGEYVIISGSAGAVDTLNGTWLITDVPTPTTFEFMSPGANTGGPIATPGDSRIERVGLANSGSKIVLTNAIGAQDTRITGNYIWDGTAAFVLSSSTATINTEIRAGQIVRLVDIGTNDLDPAGGYVVFDYGMNSQEGPIRYLYKPSSTTLAIDPSYVFKKSHDIGSSLVSIRKRGAHIMSGKGSEFAPYVTDPSEARRILQELINSVKSAGIFVNFLVRYPRQLYATLDVYQSGVDPDA